MATVRKRTDTGMYFVDLIIRGRRKRISLKTRNEAEANRRKFMIEAEENPQVRTRRVMLYEFLDRHQEHTVKRKRETTRKNDQYIIGKLKSYFNEDRDIRTITIDDAEDFIDSLRDEVKVRKDKSEHKLTEYGLNFYIRGLRAIFNYALTMKLIDENPFTAIPLFIPEEAPPRIIKEHEVIAFFEKLFEYTPEYSDLIFFYLYTGLRRNEALNLQWTDIDFDEGIINVSRNTKRKKYRVVPILGVVRDILKRRNGNIRPFADAPSGSAISHMFLRTCKRAGLVKVRLHDIRKTFGSMLAKNNVNSLVIQKILGHAAGSDVTTRFYIGLDEDTQKRIESQGKSIEKKLRKIKKSVESKRNKKAG